MSDTHEKRVTEVTITQKGEPIFHARSLSVRIEDEGGGEYVVINQSSDKSKSGEHEIFIDPEEWPMVCSVIQEMVECCR